MKTKLGLIAVVCLSACSEKTSFQGNLNVKSGSNATANAEQQSQEGATTTDSQPAPLQTTSTKSTSGTIQSQTIQPQPAPGVTDFYACNKSGALTWDSIASLPLDQKCIGTRVKIYKHWKYNFYVQLRECNNNPMQYEINIGTSPSGPFYWIADGGGHGQDQCEFVNREFKITIDDDIKSACPNCNMGCRFMLKPAYFVRSAFGETPEFSTQEHIWADSVIWHSCDISFDNVQ